MSRRRQRNDDDDNDYNDKRDAKDDMKTDNSFERGEILTTKRRRGISKLKRSIYEYGDVDVDDDGVVAVVNQPETRQSPQRTSRNNNDNDDDDNDNNNKDESDSEENQPEENTRMARKYARAEADEQRRRIKKVRTIVRTYQGDGRLRDQEQIDALVQQAKLPFIEPIAETDAIDQKDVRGIDIVDAVLIERPNGHTRYVSRVVFAFLMLQNRWMTQPPLLWDGTQVTRENMRDAHLDATRFLFFNRNFRLEPMYRTSEQRGLSTPSDTYFSIDENGDSVYRSLEFALKHRENKLYDPFVTEYDFIQLLSQPMIYTDATGQRQQQRFPANDYTMIGTMALAVILAQREIVGLAVNGNRNLPELIYSEGGELLVEEIFEIFNKKVHYLLYEWTSTGDESTGARYYPTAEGNMDLQMMLVALSISDILDDNLREDFFVRTIQMLLEWRFVAVHDGKEHELSSIDYEDSTRVIWGMVPVESLTAKQKRRLANFRDNMLRVLNETSTAQYFLNEYEKRLMFGTAAFGQLSPDMHKHIERLIKKNLPAANTKEAAAIQRHLDKTIQSNLKTLTANFVQEPSASFSFGLPQTVIEFLYPYPFVASGLMTIRYDAVKERLLEAVADDRNKVKNVLFRYRSGNQNQIWFDISYARFLILAIALDRKTDSLLQELDAFYSQTARMIGSLNFADDVRQQLRERAKTPSKKALLENIIATSDRMKEIETAAANVNQASSASSDQQQQTSRELLLFGKK